MTRFATAWHISSFWHHQTKKINLMIHNEAIPQHFTNRWIITSAFMTDLFTFHRFLCLLLLSMLFDCFKVLALAFPCDKGRNESILDKCEQGFVYRGRLDFLQWSSWEKKWNYFFCLASTQMYAAFWQDFSKAVRVIVAIVL